MNLRDRIATLEEEAELHHRLIQMQHERVLVADKAWQKAYGKTSFPDLGDLVDWLMGQIAVLEAGSKAKDAALELAATRFESFGCEAGVAECRTAQFKPGQQITA